MINQIEIPVYLEEALPEIYPDLVLNGKSNAYDAMSTLTAFTCQNIKAHNYNVVKRCFKIADKLYSKGNTIVKNAVQNVFVYSFTKMFQNYPAEKPALLAILPITLYSLYITQVHHSGCKINLLILIIHLLILSRFFVKIYGMIYPAKRQTQ